MKILSLILLSSFLLKGTVRCFLSRSVNYWESGYSLFYQMAQNFLREGRLFWGHYETGRPPLYPLFVASVTSVSSSATVFIFIQAFFSTLIVLLVYQITTRICNTKAALWAAGMAAFYPYTFFHDTQLQETVLYNLFSLVSVGLLVVSEQKKSGFFFFLAGLFLGLSTLTRLTHTVHSIFLIAFAAFFFRKNRGQGFRFAGALLLGLCLCLAPWIIRNKKAVGSYTLTSKTGHDLAMAHNPFTFSYFPYRGSIDRSAGVSTAHWSLKEREAFQRLSGDEMAQSAWYQARALDYIRTHKIQTLKRGLDKVAVNFLGILSPLHTPLENTAYFLSYWLFTLLALVSLATMWKTFYGQIFLTLIFSQSVISFVFWAHTSHRSFLDPLLAVLAGMGLERLFQTLKRKSITSPSLTT